MPINGTYYSWEDITVLLPWGPQVDLTEIEYTGERDVESVYGQGGAPRGAGRGNWKGEGKMKMKREQYTFLLGYVAAVQKSIFTMQPFTITVNYMNNDQGMNNDQLLRCRFKKSGKKAAQGDKSLDVELEFICEDIEEDGVSQVSGLNLFS